MILCLAVVTPLKLTLLPARSLLPSSLYLDHSHCPVLAPATRAALPSTRAIETRLLPSSLTATHRGFAFYVAFPKRSIPSLATCSMSLIPFAPFAEWSRWEASNIDGVEPRGRKERARMSQIAADLKQ